MRTSTIALMLSTLAFISPQHSCLRPKAVAAQNQGATSHAGLAHKQAAPASGAEDQHKVHAT